MGLVHTLHYLDFSSESWKLISNNPTIFEAIADNVVLEIRDISHRENKLVFKKGGKIEYMRSVGKYRLRWNDEDLTN
jgi:aminoglycoside phosphotransferase family enzyme